MAFIGAGRKSIGRVALVAGLAMLVPGGASLAQDQGSAVAGIVQVSIPAGPLERALLALGRQTSLRLVYESALTAGKTTAGVEGGMTAQAALARLLSGTGITYRFMDATTVTLSPLSSGGIEGTDGSVVLDTVSVTADINPQDAPYVRPGSSSYVSAEQLERVPPTSNGDVFRTVPGVLNSMNRNGSAIDVNIRGMQGMNRVKVAIDGTQQSTSTWRGYQGVDNRSYIDPDLIGGIMVEKGPTAGADGAGAIGGVVSIRTLNIDDIVPHDREYGVRLRGGISSNNIAPPESMTTRERTDQPDLLDFESGSASIAAGFRGENFDVMAAFARRRNGNYFAGSEGPATYRRSGMDRDLSLAAPGEEVFNTSEDTTSGLAKLTFHFQDGQRLELGYSHFEGRFGEISPSVLTQPGSYRQTPLGSIKTQTYTLRYRWKPEDNDLIDLKFDLWSTDVEEKTHYNQITPVFPQWGIFPRDNPRSARTDTHGGSLQNTSLFHTGLGEASTTYGFSYTYEDAETDPYYSESSVLEAATAGQRQVGSLFSSGEWKPLDWLKLNAGLRYDFYATHDASDTTGWAYSHEDRSGGRVNPIAAVSVIPVEGVQLFIQYAEGFRPPSLRESTLNSSRLLPNPNLRPEIAKNWEYGLNVSRDDVLIQGDLAQFKLVYFDNSYDDYISRVRNDASPTVAYYTIENIPDAHFSGLEVSGSYDMGTVFAEGSFTLYDDIDLCRTPDNCLSTGLTEDYSQNHLPPEWTASATLGVRLFEEALELGSRVTYASDRFTPFGSIGVAQNAGWRAYTLVDAFGSFKVNESLQVNLSAENLFDRYYVDALANSAIAAPGRTWRASVTARF